MSLAVAHSSRRVRPSVSRSDLIPEIGISTGTVVLMVAVHWLMRDRGLERIVVRCPWLVRSVAQAVMLAAIVALPGEDRAFIYFQF